MRSRTWERPIARREGGGTRSGEKRLGRGLGTPRVGGGTVQCPPPLSGGRPKPVAEKKRRAPVAETPSIEDAAGRRIGMERTLGLTKRGGGRTARRRGSVRFGTRCGTARRWRCRRRGRVPPRHRRPPALRTACRVKKSGWRVGMESARSPCPSTDLPLRLSSSFSRVFGSAESCSAGLIDFKILMS